jgi:hypothetical protein
MKKFKITTTKTQNGILLDEPRVEIVEIEQGGFAPRIGDGSDSLTYPIISIRITSVEEVE